MFPLRKSVRILLFFATTLTLAISVSSVSMAQDLSLIHI